MPSDAGTVPCSTSSMTLSSDALGSHAIPCRATALNEAADHEWLRDLCRAPRTVRETAGACHAQAHAPDQEQAAADEADWDWLRSLCRAPRTALVASRDASPLRFLAVAAEAPRKLGAAPPRPVLLQCPSRSKQLSICPKIGSADWLMRESWAIAQHALKLGAFSSWRHYQVLRADFANYLGGAAVAFGPHAYSSTRCISHGMP